MKDGVVVLSCAIGRRSSPYACLSYCWGADLRGVVVTSKENIGAHQLGLPLSALPNAIQDAAAVCQGLNLRYLWVDSLCIIQNDPEDWKRESGRMHDVYSNSYITIAAHHTKSCKESFLGQQELGNAPWQRDEDERGRTMPPPPLPLDTRGWTLQETILPSRIIHFNGYELSWECNTRVFCECETYSKPWQRDLVLDGWMEIVRQYTARALTVSSDKPMAVAGLAQMVQATIPEGEDTAYFAGLFRGKLLQHLLWVIIHPRTSRPVHSLAPSWSWISVGGPVQYANLASGELRKHWGKRIHQLRHPQRA
ncbi:heterokaryon incompatibility protein-domain-containing protein [Cercophora newfieldiana]|uniref:Heterokaryon incompatibility protein-domain-containing protein n=1 Tax=Cercophora newfieldiana TaxID=92897 RepID=A0AA40CQ47_9PEZI|nr:heterokaryon incompatibility protein-domain-containing protein [Cercophora newfieldiana]